MLAVAAVAFALGGWVLEGLVLAVGLGTFVEFAMLVRRFAQAWPVRALWLLLGAGYIGLACRTAVPPDMNALQLLEVVGSVIAVDVGAYFAGRGLGGPKIAPKISPSKTWAGLGGAVLAATAFYLALATIDFYQNRAIFHEYVERYHRSYAHFGVQFHWLDALLFGPLTALVAQAGDFFESWLKRRAGVKDSGRLIPGHGGVFDRTDGLIAVLFVIGILRFGVAMVRG